MKCEIKSGKVSFPLHWVNYTTSLTFADHYLIAMKKRMLKTLGLLGLALLFSCQAEPGTSDRMVEEIKTEGKISSIIRNPINADGTVDSVNVAKFDFEETVFDFGEVDEGAVIKHEFKFVNSGKVPLVIENAHSTCGCTIPEWPKELIEPGKGAVIKVEFNTKGKLDFQEKPIIITANTFPNETKLFIKGIVHKVGK